MYPVLNVLLFLTVCFAFTSIDLRVQFEREVYSVREDAREVMVKIIATSTASFDYEVDITLSDINAICKLYVCTSISFKEEEIFKS